MDKVAASQCRTGNDGNGVRNKTKPICPCPPLYYNAAGPVVSPLATPGYFIYRTQYYYKKITCDYLNLKCA